MMLVDGIAGLKAMTQLVGMLLLTLGFPIVAFVAAAHVGGVNPSLMTNGLIFIVVGGFLVAALFEIKRIVDQPRHHD
jgi:hypothetical protein